MTKPITIRFAPAENQQWSIWQKRLAIVTVRSFFLAPRSARKRSRLRTALYSKLLSHPDSGEMPQDIRTFLVRRQVFGMSDVLELSPLKDYLERLRIEDGVRRSKSTRIISPIVTVGLIVKVLASEKVLNSKQEKKARRKVTMAREYIEENYRTGFIIRRNTDDQKKAWNKWKSIAHLCAALVDFLQRQPGRQLRLDRSDWQRLEDDIPDFLATANYYQQFLLGQLVIKDVPLASRTAKEIGLRQLPPLSLGSPFVIPALPGWDENLDPVPGSL